MSQEPQIFTLTAHTLLTSDFLTIQKKDSSKIEAQLSIPSYQRPYRWGDKKISALINDLREYHDTETNKKPLRYRLGTLILHYDDEKKCLNVVDGQQRLVTLHLLKNWKNENFTDNVEEVLKPLYSSPSSGTKSPLLSKSEEQARINKDLIKNFITQEEIRRIYDPKKYEFVCIVVSDLGEAFQLFDSQNSRGKPLSGINLLKAHHLRAMDINGSNESEKMQVVQLWDAREKEIDSLVSNYLFRIRQWTKFRSAKFFTKDDIDCFKGIDMGYRQDMAPFEKRINLTRIGFNSVNHLGIDKQFPFSVDQTIINGKLFFDYIFYYLESLENIKIIPDSTEKDNIEKYIYEGGTGNRYLRWMFLSGLLYFYDKFCHSKKENLYTKFFSRYFSYCYRIRAEKNRILINTIDNESSKNESIFAKINHEYDPSKIIQAMSSRKEILVITDKKRNPIKTYEELKELIERMDKIS